MKTYTYLFFITFLFFAVKISAQNKSLNQEKSMDKQSIYQFTVKDINGEDFDFADLKGKKILIVNTASKCGFTPQYEVLEDLYQNYKDENFVIVGFPSNDFGKQEPGSDEEIATFCQENYGVTFPMMSKISVKGMNEHPIYEFLTEKEKNGVKDSQVKWNFQKYLIDENGHLSEVYESRVLPDGPEIVSWIEE